MPATPISRIDGMTTSVAVKPPCKAVTAGAITLSGEQTVNGVVCDDGDRVLVKNQASSVNNGIYIVSTGDWTRAPDFDGVRDAVTGTLVIVISATGVGAVYRVTTTDDPIVFGTSALTFELALFGDSSTLAFIAAGAGAVVRTAQAKERDFISVLDYGATGDGVTDDTAAFNLALLAASGKSLYVPNPSSGYRILTLLTMFSKTRMFGESKENTRIFLDANIAKMIEFRTGCQLENLYIDGNGKTANGLNIPTGAKQQVVHNCSITNFVGTPINFATTDAGEGFCCTNSTVWPNSAANYAVVIADAVQAAAVPRKFTNFETGGLPSVSPGGSNGTFITGCFLSEILYSANSQDVQITNSRLRGTVSPFVVRGAFNSIVGCDVYAVIELAAGCQACTIGPNAYNSTGVPTNSPVDDNSGFSSNMVYHYDYGYTPTAGGAVTALGNGALAGTYRRQGNVVSGDIQMTVGTTTTFGAGIVSFALPPNAPLINATSQFNGNVRVYDLSVPRTYAGLQVIALANGQIVQLIRDDATGAFTSLNPVVPATGDIYNVSFSYVV